MSRVVYCGFKPVEVLNDYSQPSLLWKGRRLLDNNRVFGVREVDETASLGSLNDYFQPSLLQKGRHLLDNNHVFGVRKVEETASLRSSQN
ncbi:hypothetical protein MRX96_059845 [Rhipicephalus microplus]